jgi:formylglycine-generating enzyme required for sulfatase activity
VDPFNGASPCATRIHRGGSYADEADGTRVAARHTAAPGTRLPTIGFRCAAHGP